MKSRFTRPLSQVVLTAIVMIGVSIGCSASRSAGSPAQLADNSTTNQSLSTTVNSSAQEKASCTLNISQAPVLHGLKLGMTRDEVLTLFPGSKDDPDVQRFLKRAPDPFGDTELMLRPGKYLSTDAVVGVKHINFGLLDGRVYSFKIAYDGPAWPHIDKFVEKFVTGSNFPPADHWQPYAGFDNQMKTLTCSDFSIRIFAGGQGGNLNYVLMKDLDAENKLEDRRQKAREQASPTPGKQ